MMRGVKKKIDAGETLTIYCDGGARGNPGPAAIGVFVPGFNKSYSKYIGEKTNNEAEYEAVIFALKKMKQLLGGEKAKGAVLAFRLDSELLVKQVNREYKVLENKLKLLFVDILNGMQDFGEVSFVHVPREENTAADELVNRELDLREGGMFE